jgi:3-hydroxy-9,10-secoandrosta-1,3,5(10)-triene-9,17-dione monooxygenase reductase component
MTLNWANQVATAPKLVAVSVESTAVTAGLVEAGACFALSLLRRRDRAVVRRFVKPLDDEGDPARLGGFDVTSAQTGAPILALAAAWIDCRLHSTLDCGSHLLFVGEVVDCGEAPTGDPGSEVNEADEGSGILRMEDTRMNYGG